MNKIQMAEQFRRAVQMFAQSLDGDTAMIIATVFDAWKPDVQYKLNEYLTYGVNKVGDPQLYQILQAHTSQEDWRPSETPSLYKPIGIDESGYPEWSQPVGAEDAYRIGDIVSYNGQLYICTSDYCIYAPDVWGWEIYNKGE